MIATYSLKDQIIQVLWDLIITGKIEPNEPMRETYLASLLNVSRTPLREALQQLEWENILVSEPRKGFRLAKLSKKDILEIYPLRARLESFALELSGIPSNDVIHELIQINTKISKTKSSKKVVALDEAWHLLLVSNCPNKRLIKMIKTLHRQSQRYEYAYMALNTTIKKSVVQHDSIIVSLQKNQLEKAVEILAENNLVGVTSLIRLLESKNK